MMKMIVYFIRILRRRQASLSSFSFDRRICFPFVMVLWKPFIAYSLIITADAAVENPVESVQNPHGFALLFIPCS